ncbi:NAD(P)/FAD-dependent oxidoreductase [Streptomyces longwoodensis]|uniref:NAD(P)/FAD-dependent oxidoreductase n=1 Tax=Streptomyces longwoodensis TaxID=68231 RepID=UPI0036F7981D
MSSTADYDVLIIGAGVLGTAVAERLARTDASVVLVEAENDVAEHASKGNAGVAVSYYGAPDTQETQLINASAQRWEEVCSRLDVPYRRIGGVMVALDTGEAERLQHTRDEIVACGVAVESLDAAQVRSREPLVTSRAVAGLLLPDEGIIDPMRLTAAYARLAAANGCEFRFSERVTSIDRDSDDIMMVTTTGSQITARFVVNAAGVGAAEISRLAGGEALVSWPRKGQYAVLDRSFGQRLSSIVFCTHLPDTKGTNVVPTTHGSVLLGPTAHDIEDPDDRSTDPDTIEAIIESAARLVPTVRDAYVMKTFAANRPAGDEQHRLRFDTKVPALLHCTDRSAGVSISPAAAEYTLQLLQERGLDACDRPCAQQVLPPVPRLRTSTHPEQLVADNCLAGMVVCACEQVSSAEIEAALTGPVPATSVEGVRKRTGASYGRCQGSLCLAGISFMTAMHTGTGPATVLHTTRGTVGS